MTTMDLLDEFAKAALTGLMADPSSAEYLQDGEIAEYAYRLAEAMAEERERVIERRRQSARGTLSGPTQAQAHNRCTGLDPNNPIPRGPRDFTDGE